MKNERRVHFEVLSSSDHPPILIRDWAEAGATPHLGPQSITQAEPQQHTSILQFHNRSVAAHQMQSQIDSLIESTLGVYPIPISQVHPELSDPRKKARFERVPDSGRLLISVAGVPGSGKTTVSARMVEGINARRGEEIAAMISMVCPPHVLRCTAYWRLLRLPATGI